MSYNAPMLPERFWSKVDRLGAAEHPHCWIWKGARGRHACGVFSFDGKLRIAHRLSYEDAVEPIPTGLVIDHLCRNPACVNPLHLEPVTISENTRRGDSRWMVRKAIAARVANTLARTSCKRGHEYPAKKDVNGRGSVTRRCSVCAKQGKRERKANRGRIEPQRKTPAMNT